MPALQLPTGGLQWIPGATITEVVTPGDVGAAVDFLVPIIVGDAVAGHPYNADSGAGHHTGEANRSPFSRMNTTLAVQRYYGFATDLAISADYFKRAGGPQAYFCCASPLIRASILVTSTGPVNQFYMYPGIWGAPGNYAKIKFTGGIMTVTPVMNYALLSANAASTDTRIYLKGGSKYDNPTSFLTPGTTYTFGDNATTCFTGTVLRTGQEIQSDGTIKYFVDLTAAIGTAITTANYATIVQYDTSVSIVSPTFTSGQGQLLVDWINTYAVYQGRNILGATKHADFSGVLPITVGTATALKDISAWSTVILGTSPASTLTDHQAIIAALTAGGWDGFRQTYGQTPYGFLILSSTTTVHTAWNTFSITANGLAAQAVPGWQNIAIYSAAGFTDTVVTATDSTSPVWRAQQLNNQYFRLGAGQMDRLAPYLSLMSFFFGKRCGVGVTHDCTADGLGTQAEITKIWDEAALGQLTALIRGGVITYQPGASNAPYEFVVSAGVTTCQSNLTVWDAQANSTSVDMTRTLADYADASFRVIFSQEPFVGGDETDKSQAAMVAGLLGNNLVRRGVCVSSRVGSVTLDASGAGFRVVMLNTYKRPNWFNQITIQIGS